MLPPTTSLSSKGSNGTTGGSSMSVYVPVAESVSVGRMSAPFTPQVRCPAAWLTDTDVRYSKRSLGSRYHGGFRCPKWSDQGLEVAASSVGQPPSVWAQNMAEDDQPSDR